MAVNLVGTVEKLIDKGASDFVEQTRMTAVSNAPVDTGMLAGSISWQKVSLGSYIVSTHAAGYNGFEYPARIEAGEGVAATRKKALHFWSSKYGEVYAKSVGASAKSHFMRNTVNSYGGH